MMKAPAFPSFQATFGRDPEIVATAPGRVNLLGDHTDYSGGFVLPMAIPQRTRVELARRGDRTVHAVSEALGGEESGFTIGEEKQRRGWIDYVMGCVWALGEAGLPCGGFDARVTSEVPVGSGLSSSAALEVALLRALSQAFGLALDEVTIARLGRKAETGFVGVPVGVMDQMASSLADEETALFLDTRTLAYERLPLPPAVELLVIDSGVAHDHAAGDYRTRRAECDRAAEMLKLPELRDLPSLEAARSLPPPLDRRVRHVFTENARVLSAAALLRAKRADGLGELFDLSHASLRDDFEVSVPDVDRLVEIARGTAGVRGARLTGGGFGGAIVAIVDSGKAALAGRHIVEAYGRGGTRAGRVLIPVPVPVSIPIAGPPSPAS